MSLKRILIASMAAIGLGAAHTSAATNLNQTQRLVASAKSGEQTREIRSDIFGRFAGGMARAPTAATADVRQMSGADRRPVRAWSGATGWRARGISGQRI